MKTMVLVLLALLPFVHSKAQKEGVDSTDGRIFLSYFDTIGPNGNLLPKNASTAFLYGSPDEQDSRNSSFYNRIYALRKIHYPHNCDFLVVKSISDYNQEQSDNQDGGYSTFYLIFKNGKLVNKPFENVLESTYWGEGGEASQSYEILSDSTLLLNSESKDSESATGYSTSIDTNQHLRYRIDSTGAFVLKDENIRFDSKYFYLDSLIDIYKSMDQSKEKPDSANSYGPSIANPYPLCNRLSFCVITINGKLYPKFESFMEGDTTATVIDTYIPTLNKLKEVKSLPHIPHGYPRFLDVALMPNGHFVRIPSELKMATTQPATTLAAPKVDIDINFDGYPDEIEGFGSVNEIGDNFGVNCSLYNPTTKQYEHSSSFSKLLNPSFDKQNKVINERFYTHISEINNRYKVLKFDSLQLVKTDTIGLHP